MLSSKGLIHLAVLLAWKWNTEREKIRAWECKDLQISRQHFNEYVHVWGDQICTVCANTILSMSSVFLDVSSLSLYMYFSMRKRNMCNSIMSLAHWLRYQALLAIHTYWSTARCSFLNVLKYTVHTKFCTLNTLQKQQHQTWLASM